MKASGYLSATGAVGGSTAASVLRLQVLPGQTGKVHVGTSSGDLKVLWPNTGSYNVGEGHSERFRFACADGSNCFALSDYSWSPEVSGENLIIAAFGR